MDEDRNLSPSRSDPAGLETCAACGRPFVVPVALLDIVDEGLYLLALHCKNCDRLWTGVHEDAELEALEQANDAAVAAIEAATAIVPAARIIDELGRFAGGLHARAARPAD
ncbi:MAG TPA: hypothetical protein VNT03_13065 [Baekduia sp.]|nr:hypothetical protein [Baekduia sp.]